MILLQFSAGQGPCECQLAVTKAIALFEKQANSMNLKVQLLEEEQGLENASFLICASTQKIVHIARTGSALS